MRYFKKQLLTQTVLPVFLISLGSISIVAAQEKPADYVQEIPGTPVNFKMMGIPGGEFSMGSPASEAGREADEGPTRCVRLAPFWMGQYEITWDIYEMFVYKRSEEHTSELQSLMHTSDEVFHSKKKKQHV